MRNKLSAIAAAALTTLVLAGCNSSNTTVSACTGTETSTERLFLQELSDNSVIIKWKGTATSVCVGTDASNLTKLVAATTTAGDHKEAKVTGLLADTKYYYSVGAASTAPSSQEFKTAPTTGYPKDDNNTRIWIVGDSGSAGYTHTDADATVTSTTHYLGVADGVRLGMETFTKADGEPIDMMLMLGDNAYNNGDEQNYQAAVFDLYKSELKNVGLWSTIGNHEMGVGSYAGGFYGGVSTESDPNKYIVDGVAGIAGTYSSIPYLDIFSMPTAGEAGGVASGTEQYYSFNYGAVHVVSLDSQLTARDATQRATMKDWLISDLSANTSDWTVVIFHHPPYSKGANHDSDADSATAPIFDQPIVNMRNEFVPIFQQYGVDMVLNGHSHSYERSYYLTNLYSTDPVNNPTAGDSDSFDVTVNTADNGYTGRSEINQEYTETDGYVIYSTAGNGGKADTKGGGMNDVTEWLNHKAMVEQPFRTTVAEQVSETSTDGVDHTNGLAIPGSVLIDANASRLEVRMLDKDGIALDKFVVNK